MGDCNFRYRLYPHQFVAVVNVAGIDMTRLLQQFSQLSKEDYESLVMIDDDSDDEGDEGDDVIDNDIKKKKKKKSKTQGVNFRRQLCVHSVSFVETQGFLLAD